MIGLRRSNALRGVIRLRENAAPCGMSPRIRSIVLHEKIAPRGERVLRAMPLLPRLPTLHRQLALYRR
jgi:hypothetical protein